MKWWIAVVLIACGCIARPVFGQELNYTKFHSEITIQPDASISVHETITANFITAHHGIYRTIPYRYTTTNGSTASIPLDLNGVTMDGGSVRSTTSTDGTNLIVKIGDPNRTISGQHEYTIQYTARAAVNFFSDHDELYWNVTGDQWDAPIENVSATIQFANAVVDANGSPPAMTQTACFTGVYGSTASNCTKRDAGQTATFTAQNFLTVVVGWPTGFITKPENYDAVRSQGTAAPLNTVFRQPSPVTLALNIIAFLAIIGGVFWYWQTHGRDPIQRRAIIAQYDPPSGLRPAELYAVMHENISLKSLVSVTVIDLAVRGYLTIREVTKDTLLGLGHQRDYDVQQHKPIDSNLQEYEQHILNVLFTDVTTSGADETIRLSDLKKRKYTSNPFQVAQKSLMDRLTKDKYFVGNPMTVKVVVGMIATALLGISIYLMTQGVFAWGGAVASLIVFGFIPAMPQRTTIGAEAAWEGHGFRLFLEKAEQYRIQWQERENIFEQFLPYAMVFGLADRWSKALADVAKQPGWYTSASNDPFNAVVFWGAMSNFGSSVSSAVVSSAASGGSGFGGGGFSGGGGGGGGGGGW